MRVMHICHHKLVIDHQRECHHIILLRNQLAPVLTFGMLDINSNDPAVRRIQRGLDIKHRAVIANKRIIGIGLVQQSHKWAITLDGTIVEAIFRVCAMPDVQHQVGAIIGDEREKTEFFEIRPLVDQHIIGLRCAERMPVDAAIIARILFWHAPRLRQTIVKKAAVIVSPGNTAKLTPVNHLRIIDAVLHLAHAYFLPVAAMLR